MAHLPRYVEGELQLNSKGLGRGLGCRRIQGVKKKFIRVRGKLARRVRLISGWGLRAVRVLPAGTRIATLTFTDDPNLAYGTSKVKVFQNAQPFWALPPTHEHMGALVDSCEPGGKANARFMRSSSDMWTVVASKTIQIGQVIRASYAERRGCEGWVALSQRGAGRHNTRSALARAQTRNGSRGPYPNRFSTNKH